MKQWWDCLPADEQARRIAFSSQYDSAYQAFRTLPLSECRHVSQHRTGLPDVNVSIRGSFVVVYVGGPGKAVPISETPEFPNPALQFMAKPRPLQPHHVDFSIGGQPLFSECLNYLNSTQALITGARDRRQRARSSTADRTAGVKANAPPAGPSYPVPNALWHLARESLGYAGDWS